MIKLNQKDGIVYVNPHEILYIKQYARPNTSLLMTNEDKFESVVIFFKNSCILNVIDSFESVCELLNMVL